MQYTHIKLAYFWAIFEWNKKYSYKGLHLSKTKQTISPFSSYAVLSDIVFQIFWGGYAKFPKHWDF